MVAASGFVQLGFLPRESGNTRPLQWTLFCFIFILLQITAHFQCANISLVKKALISPAASCRWLEQHVAWLEQVSADMPNCPLFQVRRPKLGPPGRLLAPQFCWHSLPVGSKDQQMKMECLRLKTIFSLKRADSYSVYKVTDHFTSWTLGKPTEWQTLT